MPANPFPIRIEQDLHDLLSEGTLRTRHKKQELIRLTLRRHLKDVIEAEASELLEPKLTNVQPWPKGALAAAYQRTASENWDKLEDEATRLQGMPSFDD